VKYLIWSNQHQAFWRPDKRGYACYIEEAGRYDEAEAVQIVLKASCDFQLKTTRTNPITGEEYVQFPEVMVLAPEHNQVGVA
jgi:hypothetical protein